MNAIARIVAKDKNLAVLTLMTVATLAILISLLGQRFLSANNLQSMGTQVSEFGLLALAMGIAMLTGGIDLSIVAASVLAGIVAAQVMSGALIPVTTGNSDMLMVAGVLAAILTGLVCGLLNGFLIAKVSIPPILATLGTMILFTGIGMVLTNGQSVPIAVEQFASLSGATVANIPVIFIVMVLCFIVVGFVLRNTRFGRRVYLYGENNVALRFSGVRTERVVILSYALIGVLVGLAAVIMVSRVNSARVGFGESYLLQAILVVVLAGFNPYGGRGKVISLVLGLVLLQSLQSAFTIMQFNPFVKTFIWGAMLLAVMVINFFVARWQPGKRAALRRSSAGGAGGVTGPQASAGARRSASNGNEGDPDAEPATVLAGRGAS